MNYSHEVHNTPLTAKRIALGAFFHTPLIIVLLSTHLQIEK